ncbi:hypothetical protein, partial [Kerstersia similis]|uniref:hypothetical protein n=1 Tax=Kerstersia similis TaxID=206505 RepID=UPI0039F07EDD
HLYHLEFEGGIKGSTNTGHILLGSRWNHPLSRCPSELDQNILHFLGIFESLNMGIFLSLLRCNGAGFSAKGD